MEYPPLLPHQRRLLRHGRQPRAGERVQRVRVTDLSDGSRHDGGRYRHQSTPALVMSLLSRVKTQGVWDKEAAWQEFMDAGNLGSAWLREQADARAVFDDMWERAYVHQPKASQEQVTALLVAEVDKVPGVHRAQLLRIAASVGWRNRGHVLALLDALVADGALRDERQMRLDGTVATRRFWKRGPSSATTVAKRAAVAVGLGLLALDHASAGGHRFPKEDRSYTRLLTDRRLRAAGFAALKRLLGVRWQPRRPRPDSRPRPKLTDDLRRYLLDGLNLAEDRPLTPWVPGASAVRCLL